MGLNLIVLLVLLSCALNYNVKGDGSGAKKEYQQTIETIKDLREKALISVAKQAQEAYDIFEKYKQFAKQKGGERVDHINMALPKLSTIAQCVGEHRTNVEGYERNSINVIRVMREHKGITKQKLANVIKDTKHAIDHAYYGVYECIYFALEKIRQGIAPELPIRIKETSNFDYGRPLTSTIPPPAQGGSDSFEIPSHQRGTTPPPDYNEYSSSSETNETETTTAPPEYGDYSSSLETNETETTTAPPEYGDYSSSSETNETETTTAPPKYRDYSSSLETNETETTTAPPEYGDYSSSSETNETETTTAPPDYGDYSSSSETTETTTSTTQPKTPPPRTKHTKKKPRVHKTTPTTVRPHRKPKHKKEGKSFIDSKIDWSKVDPSVAVQEINSMLHKKQSMLQTATDSLSRAILHSVKPTLSNDIERQLNRYGNYIGLIEKLVKKYIECTYEVYPHKCRRYLKPQIKEYTHKARQIYHDMNKHVTHEMKAFKQKMLACQGRRKSGQWNNSSLEENPLHKPFLEHDKNQVKKLVVKADKLVQTATKKIEL